MRSLSSVSAPISPGHFVLTASMPMEVRPVTLFRPRWCACSGKTKASGCFAKQIHPPVRSRSGASEKAPHRMRKVLRSERLRFVAGRFGGKFGSNLPAKLRQVQSNVTDEREHMQTVEKSAELRHNCPAANRDSRRQTNGATHRRLQNERPPLPGSCRDTYCFEGTCLNSVSRWIPAVLLRLGGLDASRNSTKNAHRNRYYEAHSAEEEPHQGARRSRGVDRQRMVPKTHLCGVGTASLGPRLALGNPGTSEDLFGPHLELIHGSAITEKRLRAIVEDAEVTKALMAETRLQKINTHQSGRAE